MITVGVCVRVCVRGGERERDDFVSACGLMKVVGTVHIAFSNIENKLGKAEREGDRPILEVGDRGSR